jgi:hypothetical protein
MMDFANMLEYSSIGANISSKLINCLLFADDVVLIAESPEELQELLNISNAFANKWNLKFNPKKSKILITSKKINKEGTWKLGNEPIGETGESTFSYIFLSSLQHFPFIPFSHSNAKRPSRQTLSKAFDRSKKAK